MTKKEYKVYLKSKHWKLFRRKTITSACWCCGAKRPLNLHHTTYETLHRETFMDVVTLCEPCHTKVHELINRRDALLFNAHFILKGITPPAKPRVVRVKFKRVKVKQKQKNKWKLTKKQWVLETRRRKLR